VVTGPQINIDKLHQPTNIMQLSQQISNKTANKLDNQTSTCMYACTRKHSHTPCTQHSLFMTAHIVSHFTETKQKKLNAVNTL
jgi:hypothetical protein